jgi:photosystem II stability/assembly factor-like uncharacterized protein
VHAIAVDPDDPRRLYIAMGGAFGPCGRQLSAAALFASEDRGAHWTRVRDLALKQIYRVFVAPDPRTNARQVFVVGDSGVEFSDGNQWEHLPAPEGRTITHASIGRMPGSGAVMMYVLTPTSWTGRALRGGIFVSHDGGRSWSAASESLVRDFHRPGEGEPIQLRAIACAAERCGTAYVGFSGLRTGPADEQLLSGIGKTTDGGRTWTIVHRESIVPSADLEPSWIETRAINGRPSIWFDLPYDLGVEPSKPEICYATDLFRTYMTTDGGRRWRQVNSVRTDDGGWTTRGLDVTTAYGVHFDPFDLKHMFITYTDIGLFQSRNGGASWQTSTEGIPSRWRNTTYWVVFDPQIRGLMWGGFSGTHDLPRPKMWRRTDPATYQGGVAMSTDGGSHWTPSTTGMPESAVTHVLLDPTSPAGRRTLFATAFGRGVYKSTDNGNTWVLKNDGITEHQPFAWRLTRSKQGILYLVVARRSECGAGNGDGALYRSADGGEHWIRMSLPAGTTGPTGLAVDADDERRLYLTSWAVSDPTGDSGGGVFLSTDGGVTWRILFAESQHVYDVTVDPRDPKQLYICGFDAGAFRSTDRGAHWTRIRGYNFKWGHRVIPDPVRPDQIYITTFGGSVWHGPAAGDRNAIEDLAPPTAARP